MCQYSVYIILGNLYWQSFDIDLKGILRLKLPVIDYEIVRCWGRDGRVA